MPADSYPAAARLHDDVIIEIERNNRRPANRSNAYDAAIAAIPGKVLRPMVMTRMKERHAGSC